MNKYLNQRIETMSKQQTIAVTGASGFVGEIVCAGLRKAGYKVVEYDCYGGCLYRLLNKKLFMPAPVPVLLGSRKIRWSLKLWKLQKRVLGKMLRMGLIKKKPVDILDRQSVWVDRFKGIDTVVHLAAIPHPNVPRMTATDFELVNYWGSRNLFEAAKQAGVKRFVFASSGQVYDINNYRDWTEFPIREEEAEKVQSSREVHPYSRFKWEVEKFLTKEAAKDGMVAVALRLEFPGLLGGGEYNLWIQTSVENLQDAFCKSVSAELSPGCCVCNISNEVVPRQLGDVKALAAQLCPNAAVNTTGNQTLWSVEKAKRELNYAPEDGGSYFHIRTVFG